MNKNHINEAITLETGRMADYFSSLDEMHEAEKSLRNQFTSDEYHYWRLLQHVKPNPIYATADQRAEAFLRVKGLWKE